MVTKCTIGAKWNKTLQYITEEGQHWGQNGKKWHEIEESNITEQEGNIIK